MNEDCVFRTKDGTCRLFADDKYPYCVHGNCWARIPNTRQNHFPEQSEKE